MESYELTLVLDPKLRKEEKEELLERVKGWFEQVSAKVAGEKEWGVKDLSYEVDGNSQALYYFLEIEGEGNLEKMMQEKTELEDSILRHLFVKLKKNG